MENEKKLPPINGGYPLHTFEDVKNLYENYISSVEDRKKIEEAFNFIVLKHDGQTRKSGEPYYHHLIEVAYIVTTLNAGPNTIIAALLHDVVEDTDVEIDYIEKVWGSDVAKIVDSLTKIQRLKLSKMTASEFEAEDHRKILIGMAKDIRVIIIKFADRLHNLRTLGALSEARQIAISKETMEVFVPIAHRLGLDKIKSEMQDLCLSYLKPDKFEEIKRLLSGKEKSNAESLERIKKRIADALFEHNLPFDISARVKSIYSIYHKMYDKGHPFEEIYDILALRIITENEMQCYEILGLIHSMYKPVPGRFKDYIAMPKPNLYQSLHTTIVSGDGKFYEVQIRTKEMDDVAESGVAAHWSYKEGTYNSEKEQKEIENKLHWFREFVSYSGEHNDESAQEYLDGLSKDIFEANIYVFTPKGRVVELPKGSTPVDFAYRIHTKVGDLTVGALVNGSMVPLNFVLKTGDMVEIKTAKISQGPSERWLEFVATATAKSQIKKFLIKKNAETIREERITKGKQALIEAAKERGYNETEVSPYLEDEEKIAKYFEVETLDDVFFGMANRKPTPTSLLDFLGLKRKEKIIKLAKERKQDESPVYCLGGDNIAITLGACCTPIPGDEIKGFITRGKGITVHRIDCPNIVKETERLIDVFWREDLQFDSYPVDIVIEASDRNNLLLDIVNTLASAKVSVTSINGHIIGGGNVAHFAATVLVPNHRRLREIFNILLSLPSVFEVRRAIH